MSSDLAEDVAPPRPRRGIAGPTLITLLVSSVSAFANWGAAIGYVFLGVAMVSLIVFVILVVFDFADGQSNLREAAGDLMTVTEKGLGVAASTLEIVAAATLKAGEKTTAFAAKVNVAEAFGEEAVAPIRTKVVGVTKDNRDGSSRQRLIAEHCVARQELVLEHEADNPRDAFAMAVFVESKGVLGGRRHQIGYLQSELAEEIVARMEFGMRPRAQILQVTGGEDGLNYGVNILIQF